MLTKKIGLLTLYSLFLAIVFNSFSAPEKIDSKKYLNQPLPGTAATIFARGIVSTEALEHSAPAFSPDGKRVLWTVSESKKPYSLLESVLVNDRWTSPARPSFSVDYADDFYPSFSYDGKTLYFSSRRRQPWNNPPLKDMRIWQVQLKGNKWLQPVPFDTLVSKGEEYAHSVARNGNVYFSFAPNGAKMYDIAYTRKKGAGYLSPQPLTDINTEHYEDGPFVAPDESYLIFESTRPGGIENSIDLYISFRNKEGKWSKAINLGPNVNTKYTERFARVSPDGKYLFFARNSADKPFDIYWIDAGFISTLKRNASIPN